MKSVYCYVQVQTFERGDQFGKTPNQQTVLSPGISAVLFCFSFLQV